jgi:hypothetical protein
MAPDRLSTTFAALADPTRRAILARLMTGEVSVTELAEPFDMSLWRPCRLEAGPMKDASDWLEHYRKFWEQSFDRLDDYLRELQGKGKAKRRGKKH